MATLHMQLDFPVLKGPLGPSNSTICPRTAPKRPPKAPLCTLAADDSPKPKTDHILGYVAQNAVLSAPNPPATTHFWWFPPLKIALRATTSSKRAKNTCFGIPCGPGSFLKKVIFLHPVDLVDPFWHPPLWVTSCSLPQPTGPRFLGVGYCFGTKNGSKMGQKWLFPKMIPHHLGCLNKWNESILSPLQAILAPSKVTKCLDNGLFWDKKWVQNGSKMGFSKNDPTPFGVPKQVK